MPAQTWDEVEEYVQEAIKEGWLSDWRDKLPNHGTKMFRQRLQPSDILGLCTHHSASTNQDPVKTNDYHLGPNHISETGCPGIVYGMGISQKVEPDKVLLFHSFKDITWSQGKRGGDVAMYAGDENRHLLALLVFGDFNGTKRKGKSGDPTATQILLWQYVTAWLEEVFGFGGRGYFGHTHFGKGHCPGKVLEEHIESHRNACPGRFKSDKEWQEALLRWCSACLPKYGADGDWGYESKKALASFERAHTHKRDGIQDPFTELLLLKKYPRPAEENNE